MMVPSDDEKTVFEYLKEFRPRPAEPLNLPGAGVSVGRRFALAAVAAVVMVIAVISLRPKPSVVVAPAVNVPVTQPPMTIMELNAAVRREGDLEGALARSARDILPVTNRPNTALNALSKE